jgi:TetR/AcrR family transcriptional regulator, cholesterol catabolism regulator
MKDLAQRAGLSLATLYRYFPSKDYVLLAVSLARYQEAPMNETSRSYSAILETIEHLHLQIVRHVAAAGGSLSEQHEKLLPIVIDIFNAASLHWQAGDFSVS